jgi:hypothetical protein
MFILPILGNFDRLEKNVSHVEDASEWGIIWQCESSWLMGRSELFDASSQNVTSRQHLYQENIF